MSKFKVGDRVVCVSSYSSKSVGGITGTVIRNLDGQIGIEFDMHIDGHSCSGLGKNGYCWNVNEDDVRNYQLHPSIHITTDGTTVTATIENDGKELTAKVSADDYSNLRSAAQAALDRAWNLAASGTVREVKRQAKVGEWVRITASKEVRAVNGRVYRVAKGCRPGMLFIEHPDGKRYGDGAANVGASEYVVLEGYTPEPEKPKYYNGKVVCVEVFDDAPDLLVAGKVYTVDDGRFVWCGETRSKRRYTDFQDLVERFGFAKLIEFKGEA